ncbi:hypothetical protein HYW60_01545 [Candidatus Kaiserbacteria bacterium]|nr:hypothetical protein [Candidatus Kaiserbacteria bacterium]
MANLLSPRELKQVRSYFRARFLGTGSLVAIVCGVVALLSLLPVYAIVGAPREGSSPTPGVLSESEDREELARARLILRDIAPVASTTSSLDMLGEILSVRPAGTVITSMSFKRGEEGMIVLSGTSKSRDDINAYREILSRDARFSSVTVPIGALAGTAGSRFTLTITGTF